MHEQDPILPPGLFRREYGKIVSALVGRYGAHRLSDIEDCVQFAMTQALSHWRKDKVPANPGAWLASVAKRKLIDSLRRNARLPHDSAELEGMQAQTSEREVRLASECQNDLLSMLYLCCDPELAPRSQMVLALKTLCGFSTREISLRLFLSNAATQKRLSRGRSVLAKRWNDATAGEHSPWAYLDPKLRQERHEAVCRVVYLLFNEGYSSIRADAPIRKELCQEAIFLGQALLAPKGPDRPRSCALLALMLFHFARFEGRTNDAGEVLLLEDQDRSQWDRALIEQASAFFFEAAAAQDYSRYQAEAAIAMLHCRAPSYEQTNWQEIADIYELLGKMIPSPVYRLNQAIAIAQIRGPQAGIDLLESDARATWLSDYYLWDAALGELHRLAHDFEQANACFERALANAPAGWDRDLILARQKACLKHS